MLARHLLYTASCVRTQRRMGALSSDVDANGHASCLRDAAGTLGPNVP
jgi:hypothetical protein